ncbi:MAG TPA: bestrophin family ion channel [Yeosuana sp.]
MIRYKPKGWITFIFRFHKSDTFRKLIPMMIFIGIYTFAVCYLELIYWKISEKDPLSNITMMHNMLGFVISLLLVFRTNTAYDRWWEGRKLWGSLVNTSRNFTIKLSVILKEEHDRMYFRKLIPGYASILSKHLTDVETSLVLYEGIDLDHHKHWPNQVATMIFQKINDLHEQKKISGDQLIILNNEIQSFTDICGACERIKNTPIPYSYSAFIKKFIFFYVMTLPFGYVFNLGYYAIPVVVFIFYVLTSLELIAEEIEEPFGFDANDLPIEKISANIKIQVEEII